MEISGREIKSSTEISNLQENKLKGKCEKWNYRVIWKGEGGKRRLQEMRENGFWHVGVVEVRVYPLSYLDLHLTYRPRTQRKGFSDVEEECEKRE